MSTLVAVFDSESDPMLRSLMTDHVISIPATRAVIHNYIRCIVVTHVEPVQTRRRLYPIRCGVEVVNDGPYFERLHDRLESRDTLRTFWDHLKRRSPWARVRHRLYVRAIVLFWLNLTEPLLEPGGAAYEHDMAEYTEWGESVFGG